MAQSERSSSKWFCGGAELAVLLVAFFYLSLLGCSFKAQNLDFERAQQALERKDTVKALHFFERAIRRDPRSEMAVEAAKEAARLTFLELKDFRKAMGFYRHIVLHSKNPKDRRAAYREIASIAFRLSDYPQAIKSYHRLLELPHTAEEEELYRFRLAKSYYSINEFFQSLAELKTLEKKRNLSEKRRFDLLLLRGNTFLAQKKTRKAIEIYEKIVEKYPEKSTEEQIHLNIAVCYEELAEYQKAIEILNKVKETYPQPDFIKMRISNLKRRQDLQPGARGLKR